MDDPDPLAAVVTNSCSWRLLQFQPNELKLAYNRDQSLAAQQAFADFYEWARNSGIKGLENIEYPAIYGQGLRGARAAKDIAPFEAILAVPQTVLMMPRQIDEDPQLGPIFKMIPELFDIKKTDVAEYNKVISYMIRERRKGKSSHLHYAINVVPVEETYPWVTNPEVIDESKDNYVKSELTYARKRLMYWWDKMNQEFFTPNTSPVDGIYEESVSFQEFAWAYYYVNSRCFGEGMPSLVYTPIIDLLNHAASDNNFHSALIHIELEQATKKETARKHYTPWSVYADMNKIFPNWGGFVKLTVKRDATDFTEAVDHKVANYQHQLDDESENMATISAIRLMDSQKHIHLWQLPDWQTDRFETSDDPDDFVERAEFQQTLDQLKQLIKDPKLSSSTGGYSKEKSHFKRVETAGSDPDEYNPAKFPWYSPTDPE